MWKNAYFVVKISIHEIGIKNFVARSAQKQSWWIVPSVVKK